MLQFLADRLSFYAEQRRASILRLVLAAVCAYGLMPFGSTRAGHVQAQAVAGIHRVYLPGVARSAVSTGAASVLNASEAEAFTRINQQRAQAGCAMPLRVSPELTAAARAHSADMAIKNYLSHTGVDGSKFSTRAQRAGYTGFAGGEIIAAGYTTGAGVVDGWLNSPPHRAIMLNCVYRDVGLGFFGDTTSSKYLWTGVFGW